MHNKPADQPVELLFATGNLHKLNEAHQILDQSWLRLRSLKEVDFHDEIEETGDTLSANASIKSQAIYKAIGGNVFAEDTGLEVMALGMQPGVITARYAGPQRSADDNMAKLLAALEGSADRTARFRTVVSLIWDGQEYLFEGLVNGVIASAKRGGAGFGYDPIFIPFGHERSFAELDASIKNGISHRYRAISRMKKWLQNHLK